MNTKTTMISLKIDKDLKEKASKIAEEFGFSLSSIIKASLKKLVRERKIEYSLKEEYSPEFVKSVLQAEADYYKNPSAAVSIETQTDLENYFANL